MIDDTKHIFDITQQQLPLHCPTKDMSLWDKHPRIYLPIEASGEAQCPYCGSCFRLLDA